MIPVGIYRTDPGCHVACDADDANPPLAVVIGEGLDFDFESDHTHDY